jgi:hypothetical protein
MEFYCDQFWFCNAIPPEWHWVMGSTGGEYPASSWPQPMVDNPRVCGPW